MRDLMEVGGEGGKWCSGEVTWDDGLGRQQMAKEVSLLLRQFKDKATCMCLGEILSVACSEGSKFFSLHSASLPLQEESKTCEWWRGCF